MKIINPNEIGTKISTLIAESLEKVIIVSPYINIYDWKKICINLRKAVLRNVKIEIYYRELKEYDKEVLDDIGVKLIHVPGLHTKLYFSENRVIVSSMNLYEYSDLNSIEIAIDYFEDEDYGKLFDYFEKYIKRPFQKEAYDKSKIGKYQQRLNEENTLGNLKAKLEEHYQTKIGQGSNYLFAGKLSPLFDFFFYEDEISLKICNKQIESHHIDKISNVLSNIEGINFSLSEPTETDKYYRYKVNFAMDDEKFLFRFIDTLKIHVSDLNS